jgi:hypothetical protein
MRTSLYSLVLLLLALAGTGTTSAQEQQQPGDEDGSSERVESSDEAYRRRMELEDARRQDPSYTDPVDTYKKEQEKIDKLPEESRDNIRDQLIDVIVENGEWEPSDALETYPYEPSEAARSDPMLKEQEQEAWDEQIEKYHEREAAAFGAHRGPVPGPGNPTGQEGGGEAAEGQQQGGDQGGGSGSAGGEGGSGSAGTYQPRQSNRKDSENEVSTAGVSESALDFLRGKGRKAQAADAPLGDVAPDQPSTDGQEQSAAQWAAQQQQQQQQQQQEAEQAAEEAQNEAPPETDLVTPGIIAIKDLDKLEGAGAVDEEDEDEQEQP